LTRPDAAPTIAVRSLSGEISEATSGPTASSNQAPEIQTIMPSKSITRVPALLVLLAPSVAFAHGGHPEGADALFHFILPVALAVGAIALGSKVLAGKTAPVRVKHK
jgi:hypothetical protein